MRGRPALLRLGFSQDGRTPLQLALVREDHEQAILALMGQEAGEAAILRAAARGLSIAAILAAAGALQGPKFIVEGLKLRVLGLNVRL